MLSWHSGAINGRIFSMQSEVCKFESDPSCLVATVDKLSSLNDCKEGNEKQSNLSHSWVAKVT